MKNNLKYPKQKTKILVGITEENEIVYAEIEIESCNNNHYTINHITLQGLIKESEGEDLAREYLEDGDLWKQAVQSNHTTKSLDDWIDEVINTDGWQQVIGDLEELGEYEGEIYYIRWQSCGASIDDLKKPYKKLYITEKQKEDLIYSDKLHLKDFGKYTKKEKQFFELNILPLFNYSDVYGLSKEIPLLIEE